MKKKVLKLVLAGGTLFCFCFLRGYLAADAAIYPSGYRVDDDVRQLIVVRCKGKSRGELRFYEKNESGKWKKKWSCSAFLGQRGIGKKKEGDKKTPKGIYSLGQSFGILKNPGTKMPYIKVNRYHYWCGDSGSEYYNQLIRVDLTGHKCKGEHLIKYKGAYNYAIHIEYNKEGKAGKGSAIFLHCSRGRATAGCVAIPEKYMKKALITLRPESNPQIIIF